MQSISRKYLVTAFALAIAALISVSAFGAAADGAATFKAKCAMCHGQDATGNTPMGKNLKIRDLTSPEVQKQTDAEINDVISKGKNKMPEYGTKLTKEQIADLQLYVRTLAKK